MALSSRLAIIAGGLGGIGTATGRLLREREAKLALLYAPFESSRASQTLRASYGDAYEKDIRAYECDITSEDSVNNAFTSISTDLANDSNSVSPSILINAAGYVSLNPMESTPVEETLKHLHSNILGPMLVSQAFARLYFRIREQGMEKVPPGRIVSIASQAAHIALDKHSAYCASKAGLVGLTKCMASEWGGRGITANTVSPGPVWTALGKKAWPDDKVREAYQANIPVGRFAEPEEVATAIAFFCQDGTNMINGTDIRLDGGFTIR